MSKLIQNISRAALSVDSSSHFQETLSKVLFVINGYIQAILPAKRPLAPPGPFTGSFSIIELSIINSKKSLFQLNFLGGKLVVKSGL